MTGRGLDQVLPHPSEPQLYERWVSSALDYVRLAERRHGVIDRPVGFSYPWGEALDEWERRNPAVRIINLETSITTSADYVPKGINYRMHPNNAGCLVASGVEVCVLANNHVLDWGEAGLLETLAVLARLRLSAPGAGRDQAEAAAPAVVEIAGGGRVIVAACCTETSGVPPIWAAGPHRPGVNLIEPGRAAAERLAGEIAALRAPGDLAVVSIHWGPNWGYRIPLEHRRFAHDLIDLAGVSVVHGHSSHHPMAIEVHNGGLILYGCGDFLTDYEGIEGHEAYRPDLSVMYFADFDRTSGALARLEMAPLQMRKFRLTRPSEDDVAWLGARLDRECARFGGEVRKTAAGLVLSWPRG